MTDRSNSEVQLAFNVMAARLDRLLAKAKPYLKEQGVEIYDNCNRSGTDMSGYPYFTWSYEFMVDEELEGDIYRREVRLKYLEPWETEETHKRNQMDVQTIAEIFRKRSAPRFEWSDRSVWLIDAMGAEGLHKLLDVQFAIADKQLNPGTGLIVFPH